MFKYIGLVLCFLGFVINNCVANESGITKPSIVEKLCKTKSSDILEEQAISVVKWSSQYFNGDRTFNIDGEWQTNVGNYLVECELPYGSDESGLSVELIKE